MIIKKITGAVSVLILAFTFGCGAEGGGKNKATIQIDLGLNAQSTRAGRAPSDLKTIAVTVTGTGMNTIVETYTPDDVIKIEVPAGDARTFKVTAQTAGVGGKYDEYSGTAVSKISEGINVVLSVSLELTKGTTFAVTSNPSMGADEPRAVVVDDGYIYIGGNENNSTNERWRVEKRNIYNGELAGDFGSGGLVRFTDNQSRVNDLIIDGDFIYIIGYDTYPSMDIEWRIEKRSKTTGELITSFGNAGVFTHYFGGSQMADKAVAASHSGNYLYVSGTRDGNSPSTLQQIDKNTPAANELYYFNTSFITEPVDIIYASDNLYHLGYYSNSGDNQWA